MLHGFFTNVANKSKMADGCCPKKTKNRDLSNRLTDFVTDKL